MCGDYSGGGTYFGGVPSRLTCYKYFILPVQCLYDCLVYMLIVINNASELCCVCFKIVIKLCLLVLCHVWCSCAFINSTASTDHPQPGGGRQPLTGV